MYHRLINPLKSNSFFIFGARGVGKSTYLKTQFKQKYKYINLLEDETETRYLRHPDLLKNDLLQEKNLNWVVIDEIQKVPKLLDVIHSLIEETKIKFVLTGSSARKLKKEMANLLAGRAFNYQMFPLTHLELASDFNLDDVINWGSLPSIYNFDSNDSKEEYLRSYTQVYLKEEILQEQIVRNGVAFRNFLEIAAHENGNLLNFAKIGRDIGIDIKTVQSYFQILEDTLIGFFLPGFHLSKRKSAGKSPKFYLFDIGVKRALDKSIRSTLLTGTSGYGKAFEHFFICELYRINNYSRLDYDFYNYTTTAGGEIDLILHRGRETFAIEIKSTFQIDLIEVKKLANIAKGLNGKVKIFYVSQDLTQTIVEGVKCLHWKKFIDMMLSDQI